MRNTSVSEATRQVILIMTDSQRWDMLGCYRNTGLQTPCLDGLAARGRRFERAYTTQPVCQPARAGLFCGQYPSTCGSWTNSQGISQNARHLGQRLQKAGIRAAYIGKWHLDGSDYFGLGQCPDGWDPEYWFDMRNYLDGLTPEDRRASRLTSSLQNRDFPSEFTYAHQCSDRAIQFLSRHLEQSWLLALSYDEPHDPYLCPREYWERYRDYVFPDSPNRADNLQDKPAHHRVWAGDRLTRQPNPAELRQPAYFGCNSFVDAQIGRVLDAVSRFAPDAVILYTSDHGEMLGSHRLNGKGPAVYDEITRIPLLIQGPGIQPGVAREVASHIDLAPTVCDLLGIEVPEVMPGSSLLPSLYEAPQQELALAEDGSGPAAYIEFGRYEVDHDGFGGWQPLRAIVTNRYKLCINLMTSDELYDLAQDPGECVNRIEDPELADIRNQLHDRLLDHMNQIRDPFRGYYWRCRPWRGDAAEPSWADSGMTRQRVDSAFENRQLDYMTGLEMTQPVRRKGVIS